MKTTHAEFVRLSELIDGIYQGATDMERWRHTLPAIADWLGGRTGLLFTPTMGTGMGGFHLTHRISQSTMELYESHFAAHDEWTISGIKQGLAVEGNVLLGQDLVPHEKMLTSYFYQGFLSRVNLAYLITSVVSGPAQDTPMVICSFHRQLEDGPFQQEHKEKLALLIPHISRALGVMFRLRDAEFRVASSLAAMDSLSRGVLLFGEKGDVVFVNQAAQRLLDQNDGLKLWKHAQASPGTELLADECQEIIDAAIRDSIAPDILSAKHFSRAVAIQRPSGKAPFTLRFSSLPAKNEFGLQAHAPRAIAFLSDTGAPLTLDGELIKTTYGLTAAEMRTAECVIEGRSLDEIATQFNLSVNTIKTQLNQIYDKTGTNNRAKLVKLLISLSN